MSTEKLPPHPELPPPPAEKLNPHFILGEIRDYIRDFKELFPFVDLDILHEQTTAVRRKQVDAETQIRQFLKAFKRTETFKDAFDLLDEESQKKVNAFSDGKSAKDVTKIGFELPSSPAAKHHFRLLDMVHSLFHHDKQGDPEQDKKLAAAKGSSSAPVIYEDADDKKIMKVYSQTKFDNWGESVHNTPKCTFVPTTVLGLQNLVKWSKANNLRVRCSGYRHSWSDTFSEDNQVLISLLDLHEVTRIPDPLAIGSTARPDGNELMSIDILDNPSFNPGKQCVRVGAAVTNEAFRRWAIQNNKCALPMDVILVEVTIGGVNGPICHGGGRRHKTISDQVIAIEYVDANGTLQTIVDKEQLKAAAGCFGLLGVITHITFDLEAMTYATLRPKKLPISLAIPPLSMSEVPLALFKSWTPQDIATAQADFERRATDDYYAEWFWYTYQSTAWVNTWNTTTDPAGAKDFPSPAGVFLQWLQCWVGGWFSQTYFFHHIPGHWQAQFLAIAGMAVLPPTLFDSEQVEIKTFLPDGLHFFRGIQNCRVRDMEFEIPLPASPADATKPDLSIIQRAWWDVIKLVYAEAKDGRSPMRLTLELRIMGGSNMTMAAQRGNDHGTASIEVLTVPNAVPQEWERFKQKVADIWMGYEVDGAKLNARPHWAKEWQGLKVGDKSMEQHMKETAYKGEIAEFKEQLAKIAEAQGWTLEELQERFSNKLWDEIVYS